VDWTSFVVEDLVELVLRFVALLTTRCAIHGADRVVRLTLTHRIPLVAGPSTVDVALPVVVVVAVGKATAFLLLFICLRCRCFSRGSLPVLIYLGGQGYIESPSQVQLESFYNTIG